MTAPSKTRELAAVAAFFLLLLFAGSMIYDDYGAHWDEYHNQRFGRKWLAYVAKSIEVSYPPKIDFSEKKRNKGNRDFSIIEGSEPLAIKACEHDLSHGPAVEMILSALTAVTSDPDEAGSVILRRHLCVFLIFLVSVLAFYFLVRDVFGNWRLGLAGCLLLILSPRIFSHSFYNSVDISFLSFYILSTLTLVKFIEQKTYRSGILHALSCALLIDIRVAGLILPLTTAIFYGLDLLSDENKFGAIKKLVFHFMLLLLFVYMFWPFLWSSPIHNFLQAAGVSTFYSTKETYFWYNIEWIFFTTPLLYTMLFAIGLLSSFFSFAKAPCAYYNRHKNDLIFFSLFFIPIILPIIFRARLYDGWRHHYFVYAAFVLVALIGLNQIVSWIKAIRRPPVRAAALKFGGAMLAGQFIWIAFFIYRNHPLEYNYANFLAVRNPDVIRCSGAVDYWGLSYRRLLEHITQIDSRRRITVGYHHAPAVINADLLPSSQKMRLAFVDLRSHKELLPEYIVTNFRKVTRIDPNFYGFLSKNGYREIYPLFVDGIKISTVYKR